MNKPCTWNEEDPFGPTPGTWSGTCGVLWYLDESLAPAEEHEIDFCPKCGKPVTFIRFVGEEPDEEVL